MSSGARDSSVGGARIRVANIIEEGRFAGPQKRIAVVANSMQALGVDTHVFLPKRSSDVTAAAFDELGVSYERMTLRGITRSPRALASYALRFGPDIVDLARRLRRGGFDVVHVSGGSWQIKGVLAGKLAGIPTLWHLNDTYMPAPVHHVFRAVCRVACDGFVVTSAPVAQHYLRDDVVRGRPVFTVAAPVDCDRYDAASTASDVAIRQSASLTVTYVCNINPNKGLETFIDAAAAIGQERDDVVFWLVGPVYESQQAYADSLRERCARVGATNVRWYGPSDEVPGVLAASDVFVCVSRAESGPMCVFEALAMCVPTISTCVGDVPRVVDDGVSGYVINVDDTQALLARLRTLLGDAALRESMGMAGRAAAMATVDLRSVARAQRDAYASLLDR